jgi:hypothetical protein
MAAIGDNRLGLPAAKTALSIKRDFPDGQIAVACLNNPGHPRAGREQC